MLKIEFSLAILLSLIAAIIAVLAIAWGTETYMNSRYFKQIEDYTEQIDEGLQRAAQYIVDLDAGEEDIEALEALLNQDEYVKYVIFFREKGVDVVEFINEIELKVTEDATVGTRYYENQNGVFIVVAQSASVLRALTVVSIVMFVVLVIIFISLFSLFVGRKEKYLRDIADGVDILSNGDLTYKVPLKGHDEITYVAKNINMMTEALKEQIEKERLSEKTKNELVANISHDLRTPLTSITGYLALIDEGKNLDEKMRVQYTHIALKKSIALSELIDQLFEYVTLSNMKDELKLTKVDVNRVCQQMMLEQSILLEEFGFTLETGFEHVSVPVYLDLDRFRRVFDNLFGNILKHGSPEKPVQVTGKLRTNNYQIRISNLSKSISENIPNDVFNRYFTTDRNLNESGGLGLAIVKEIVLKHKGKISAINKNRQFIIIIDLPLEAAYRK